MADTSIFTDVGDVESGAKFTVSDPPNLLELLARRALNDEHPRVIIDGPSGSGKSTLARKLAEIMGAELVQMDHVYASWDGLAAAGQHIALHLLEPLSRGVTGRAEHWDWNNNASAGWQLVRADQGLVVEGSAALNRRSAPLSTLRVWVEVTDANARRKRALEQRAGGDIYAPYWEHWGKQEREHIAHEGGAALADIVIRPAVEVNEPLYTLVRGEL
ncbi:(d)CMP kinase [Canibacter sp. lx-72]|uniref:(d)CMP kinase n=1 Tax=Canibacter zhuwentaonis TaxID=2837491 RepID=UPI001BDD82BC|nr:(d)CMP kinase [Canibacter zhuwentaonis]MBT1018132.1 (d)CMP kinase [Canibacter zhuwentaonis]